jgi:hypothetical protein
MTKLTRNGNEPLCDFGNATDVYVDGIGRIDNNGATSQVILFQRRHLDGTGTRRVVELRLIVPTIELAAMAAALSRPETVAETISEFDAERGSCRPN